MGKFHEARSRTPFADGASRDEHQAALLRISLAHGNHDIQDTTQVGPELLVQQQQRGLNKRQLEAVLANLQDEKLSGNVSDQEILEAQLHNDRVSAWKPGGKKSRVSKHG